MGRASVFLLATLFAAPAWAQDYPAREIRSICNFSAGSGADIIVRWYSDRLSKRAGKPVVVENKPGNQGTVATDFVAKSKADGYTIMITPASSTLATAPHIFKSLPFDPAKDFAPVTTITSLSFVIAVDASKRSNIQDLINYLKRNHGRLHGTGSNSGQVAGALQGRTLARPFPTKSPPTRAPACCSGRSRSSPTTRPGR